MQIPLSLDRWVAQAKRSTGELLVSGSSSPFAWVFVDGRDIPRNAIVTGYDNGKPLYCARTFHNGGIYLGQAGRHLELGASIPYGDGVIKVEKYEVLVQAAAWSYQAQTSVADFGLILWDVKVVVLVDDSLSMEGAKWDNACQALADIAEAAKAYGTDGPDIYFINAFKSVTNARSREDVLALFDVTVRYGQKTLTASKLSSLIEEYTRNVRPNQKPVSLIVITDGVLPDDVEPTIVAAARRLENEGITRRKFGIQFAQIGNDVEATKYLQGLDDNLGKKYDIQDMVDTTVVTDLNGANFGATMTKILQGSLSYKLDGQVV